MWYTHTNGHFNYKKRKNITVRYKMNRTEGVMLSKISKKKEKIQMFSLIGGTHRSKVREQSN